MMKLVSVDELKLLLEKTDDTHDDILFLIIEYNSKRIEGYLNRKLKYDTYTEYFSGDRRRFLLSAIPVEEDSVYVYLNDVLLSEDSDYYVWYDYGIVELTSSIAFSPKSVKIRYKGGFTENEDGILQVPDDIKYACLLQCSWDFRNRDTLGLTSISLPDGSIGTRITDLLPAVKQILKQYRLPSYSRI